MNFSYDEELPWERHKKRKAQEERSRQNRVPRETPPPSRFYAHSKLTREELSDLIDLSIDLRASS